MLGKVRTVLPDDPVINAHPSHIAVLPQYGESGRYSRPLNSSRIPEEARLGTLMKR
jgi:hypothetical protein